MATRKSPAKKTNTRKSTTTRKKRTSSKKANIPAYKVIILCLGIIAVCMFLLLVTDLSTQKTQDKPSIAQRFEQPAPSKASNRPENKAEPPKQNTNTKSTSDSTNKKQDTQKVTTSKPAATNTTTTPKTENTAAAKTSTEKATASSTSSTAAKPAQPATQKTTAPAEQKTTVSNSTGNAQVAMQKPVTTEEKKTSFNFPKAQNGAQLIFVFDDGGQNLTHLEKFLKLPFPITVAVLPQIAHSEESARRVRNSGHELMLHQPMQSINSNVNPGPGAITPDMTQDQVISQLFVNINQIAPIAGFNNHEGSAITADAEMMATVLQMASDNGIFFLDSRTNVETKVPYVAKQLGYGYYERNIFLDNEKTRANVLKELNKGLALANKNGSVIMIGHIWSADFLPAILLEAYPELKEKGYTFSVVSKSKALKY